MPDISREELLTTLQQERSTLLALLPQFSDEQWRAARRSDGWTVHDITIHLADSTYGLALMVLGEIQPTLSVNQETGWMDVDGYNEQRRQKNVSLPREKVVRRVEGAFDQAHRALESVPDLDVPGPYGPVHTKGQWLRRIVQHTQIHRRELEEILQEPRTEN